jgi:hypothetical protein
VPCNFCQKAEHAIDRRCPKHCIPPLGSKCDGHHQCDEATEFCTAAAPSNGNKNTIFSTTQMPDVIIAHMTCAPCQYCRYSAPFTVHPSQCTLLTLPAMCFHRLQVRLRFHQWEVPPSLHAPHWIG